MDLQLSRALQAVSHHRKVILLAGDLHAAPMQQGAHLLGKLGIHHVLIMLPDGAKQVPLLRNSSRTSLSTAKPAASSLKQFAARASPTCMLNTCLALNTLFASQV